MAKAPTKPCPVPDCSAQVNTSYLMCPAHWRLVSVATQRRVYRTFRDWWERGLAEEPYRDAREAAIAEAKGGR